MSSSSSNPESSSTLTIMDETAAGCLMLLSGVGEIQHIEKVFSCITCGKKFANFQALGGHRASRKKPKLDPSQKQNNPSQQPKPKSHKCSICNAEFALGQALGGHMRRHRDNLVVASSASVASVKEAKNCDVETTESKVLKRSNSKRVYMGLDLDLNLAPPRRESDSKDMDEVESDLRLGMGKFDLGFVGGKPREYDLKMQFGKRRRLTLDCFV